jgi:hypothetical protein
LSTGCISLPGSILSFEDDDAVFEYLMLRAVKADDVTALDEFSWFVLPPVVSRSGPIRVMLNGAQGSYGVKARFSRPGDIDAGVDVHRRLGRDQRPRSVAKWISASGSAFLMAAGKFTMLVSLP